MRFLANENVSATVIQALRDHGHDVLAVKESLRGEKDPAILARCVDRYGVEIAGDRLSVGREQQIDGSGIMAAAAAHRVGNAGEPAIAILLGEALYFRFYGFVGLPLEQNRGVPIDVCENGPHREGKQ